MIVILAAGLAVTPLIKRSARRRLTAGVMICGIVMALVPTAIQLAQAASSTPTHAGLALISRLDAPGFAMILFGVVVAFRDMVVARDQLYKQNQTLRKDASTDFLTGLLNRRQAEFLLEYGEARALRRGEPLGFIMMDLDWFKRVNDTYGHAAGDAVLAHVGVLLKARIRSSDILARYGGEEFLVVLPEPTHDDLLTLAEDLRSLIERSPAAHDGRSIPITASFGIALSPGNGGESMESSIGRADAALYAAKALGRNRVATWEQCMSSSTMALGVDVRAEPEPVLARAADRRRAREGR